MACRSARRPVRVHHPTSLPRSASAVVPEPETQAWRCGPRLPLLLHLRSRSPALDPTRKWREVPQQQRLGRASRGCPSQGPRPKHARSSTTFLGTARVQATGRLRHLGLGGPLARPGSRRAARVTTERRLGLAEAAMAEARYGWTTKDPACEICAARVCELPHAVHDSSRTPCMTGPLDGGGVAARLRSHRAAVAGRRVDAPRAARQ